MVITKNDETATLTDLLSLDGFDVDEFDSFLATWKRLADQQDSQSGGTADTSLKIKEVESLATSALERLVQTDDKGAAAGSELFKSLQIGAVICSASGHVEQSNDQALKEYGLHDRAEIGDAHLSLENGDPFGAPFLATLRDRTALTIQQCFTEDDTTVNLAILVLESAGTPPHFLIVFMDTPWGPEAEGLLSTRFGLSDVETEIIGQFASGISLKQIAVDRGRSYQTIRNQFQAVLEKTGCPNQADLLRLLLGTSYLFSQIQTLANAMAPSPGRRIEMMRPGGRFFEVSLFGDMNGTPFVCLPSIFGQPITPAIEALLHEKKLLMLGIARPGFAGTSPPKPGQGIYECLAGDITALLDSMEIERCVVLARASAARNLFNLANLLPHRVMRGIVVNGMVPRPYVDVQQVRSSWTKSLITATRTSPTVATLILGAGRKVMLQLGVERFVARMYRRCAVDVAAAKDTDAAESMARGVEYVTQQGLRAGAQDMIDGFEDWRDEVAAVTVPITLVHGPEDPHVPIDAVRAFAREFEGVVGLIEVPDGGGLLNFTHADQILDLVKAG